METNFNTHEIAIAAEHLHKGNTILYPTDTIWGVGCDATNAEAVSKIYKLKQRPDYKSLIVLLYSPEQLFLYLKNVPENIFNILQKYAHNPTTIIYHEPQGIAQNLIAPNNTLAIRIPQRNDFCVGLLKYFNKPLVSTSANVHGQPAPTHFSNIDSVISTQVNYIAPAAYALPNNGKASTIIQIENDGKITVIRP